MPFFDCSTGELCRAVETDNENSEDDGDAPRPEPRMPRCSEPSCPWVAWEKCEYGGCARLICLEHMETSIIAPPRNSAQQPMPAPHWMPCTVCPQHTQSALAHAIVEAEKSRAARDAAELATINTQLQTASFWETMQLAPRKLTLVPELFLWLLFLSIIGMAMLPFGPLGNGIAAVMFVRYALAHGKGPAAQIC